MSSSVPDGAGRPCGTLFPWRGPGSWGGDDFRAGDSPLAAPGGWTLACGAFQPCSPQAWRRENQSLRPSVSRLLSRGASGPACPQPSTRHLLLTQAFPVPTLPVPGMESPGPRDGSLLLLSLGLASLLPSSLLHRAPDLP